MEVEGDQSGSTYVALEEEVRDFATTRLDRQGKWLEETTPKEELELKVYIHEVF